MFCTKKITADLTWVGANDRRLAMFEGVYSVPQGVSYNAYLLRDEKTVLFDTVDKAVQTRFFENLDFALDGRALDYIVVQHMEPDHSAALTTLTTRYPELKIVCNQKTLAFIKQFFNMDVDSRVHTVKEGDTLNTGKHTLNFVMAPMVHWPEVMVTYDLTDKILFSADAFGSFGALNGAVFADEVNFERDFLDEARRYYANIVGKYGTQVSALLKKASALTIEMICPLHGFVWRKALGDILSKYVLWSAYEPEEQGVMIAYASVYGNTENAAEILATKLCERGIKTELFDVSVTPASEIISAAFKWSHLVFASTTYNAGIFVSMEALLHDLAAHNIQNRTVGFIENGSWAATSGNLMREILSKCRNITILEKTVSIKSALKSEQLSDLEEFSDAIAATLPSHPSFLTPNSSLLIPSPPSASPSPTPQPPSPNINPTALYKLSYGLFVLTARDGQKDNGCIVNTVTQITNSPCRISVAVNKANFTRDMIVKSGKFNVSVLSESAPFSVFEQFGFKSGRDTDKFALAGSGLVTANSAVTKPDPARVNGIRYLTEHANAVLSATVIESLDYGTHTLFIADVTDAVVLSGEPSATYQYYFAHIKPKPKAPPEESKKGFVCKICGFTFEGDTLAADYICPLCKHGAEDFEPLRG